MDVIRKKLLEEFRKRYESEVRRKTDLNSRLSLLLGVLSLLVGGSITVLKSPPVTGPLLLAATFWIGVVIFSIIMLMLLHDVRKFDLKGPGHLLKAALVTDRRQLEFPIPKSRSN